MNACCYVCRMVSEDASELRFGRPETEDVSRGCAYTKCPCHRRQVTGDLQPGFVSRNDVANSVKFGPLVLGDHENVERATMTDARVRESCGRCHADLTGQPWNERHVCDAMIGGQVAPVPNREKASWELVIEDMRTRDEHGRGKYGTPLQPFNGRDSLWDAYEESLDQTVYLRNAITETRTLRADHNRLKFEKQVFDVEIGKRDRRIRELEGQLDNPQRDYVLEIVRQRNTELEDRIRELEAQLHTRVEHVCDVICDLAGCLPAPPTGLGPPRTDPKPAGGSEPVPADPNSREPVLPYDPNDIPF